MNRRALHLLLGVALSAILVGCNKTETEQQAPPAPAPPVVQGDKTPAPPGTATAETAPTDKTPVVPDAQAAQTALNAVLEEKVFPQGTKLQNLTLVDHVATLDFSKEFNQIKTMGESSESLAQKALMATLAKVPGVDKMRVTVEGKAFESENTDWNTPFSVHKTTAQEGNAVGGSQ